MTAPAGTGTPTMSLAAPPRRTEAQQASKAVAELTERAQRIAREASTVLVAAFKQVIADPAIADELSVESTRDLVQYLVRRNQLSGDDAERLLRSAEAAAQRRPRNSKAAASPVSVKAAPRQVSAKPAHKAPPPARTAPAKTSTARSGAKSSTAKPAGKAASAHPKKTAAKKTAPAARPRKPKR